MGHPCQGHNRKSKRNQNESLTTRRSLLEIPTGSTQHGGCYDELLTTGTTTSNRIKNFVQR